MHRQRQNIGGGDSLLQNASSTAFGPELEECDEEVASSSRHY